MRRVVRHFLGLYDMKLGEITSLLNESEKCLQLIRDSNPPTHLLSGHCIAVLCWALLSEGERGNLLSNEDIYTTRFFELASKYLGAESIRANPDPIESLSDAIRSVKANTEQFPGQRLAALILRHNEKEAPQQATRLSVVREAEIAIINGGDGNNENPTEALAYLLLLREKYGEFTGLRFLIIGDINSDPLGRSLMFGVSRLGAEVHLITSLTSVPLILTDVPVVIHPQGATIDLKPDVTFLLPMGPDNPQSNLQPCDEETLQVLVDKPTEAYAVAVRMAIFKYCLLA